VIVGRTGLLVCAGVLGASLFAPAEGLAQTSALMVSLEYEAGPGCPGVADFKAVVIARLGYDPFIEGASDHVLVRIAPQGGSLDGRIEWRDPAGKWAGDQSFPLVNTDCPHLARAMGFVLAVQIQLLARTGAGPAVDDTAGEKGPAGAPMPSPVPRPPDVATPTNPQGAAPIGARSTRGAAPVLAVGAGPSVGVGMSSTPVLLGRVIGAVAWPHLSLELAAELSLPATTRRADGAGFSQQHLLASAAACANLTRWNGCLLVNAGEVRMAGEDIDHPTSARVPVVEVGARIGVVQGLGRRMFLNAHADGLTILTRWTATLDHVAVWTAPRFAAALGVDVGVRFR
jgi:hypothetical protein